MRFFSTRIFTTSTWTLIGLALLLSQNAGAEYRAYELKIENSETNKSYSVISSLDHLQYPVYHPLNKGETIQYVDSWMCWENSSQFKKPCPKPDRSLASTKKPVTAAKDSTTAAKPAGP